MILRVNTNIFSIETDERDFNSLVRTTVNVLRDNMEDFEANNDMPMSERIQAIKDYTQKSKRFAKGKHLPKMEEILEVSFTQDQIDEFKDKDRYLPVKNITYKEYLGIRVNTLFTISNV